MKWEEMPANAQTVAVVDACIIRLREEHPYPANMAVDRTAFAASRLGYESAMHKLEEYMKELTEEIPET